jgi:hypothetical protein
MEDKMEDCIRSFDIVVEIRTRERALAPNKARDIVRVLRGIRPSNHASNIVANDMHLFLDTQMVVYQ